MCWRPDVEVDIFVPAKVTNIIDTTAVEFTMTTLNYPLSSKPLKFPTTIHQVVSDFSSFSVFGDVSWV